MSIVIERSYHVDTSLPMVRRRLQDVLQSGDRSAHQFKVTLTQNGTVPGNISQVYGYLCRADGTTVVVQGSAQGNVLSLPLSPACYDVPGQAQLVIRATQGESIVTALWLDMLVVGSVTDAVVDPDDIVPSLPDLLQRIGAMEAATLQAQNACISLQPFASLVQLPISWTLNKRIDYQTGLPVSDTNYCATQPIAIAGGFVTEVDVYTACANDSSALAFYDEDENPIWFQNVFDGTGLSLAHHSVSVPEKAAFMRFSCRIKNNFYQSACASIKTAYSDITAAIHSKTAPKSDVQTVKTALLQDGWQVMSETSGFVKQAGYYVHTNGTLTQSASYDTWTLTAPEDLRLYATSDQTPYSKYLTVALYSGSISTGTFLLRRKSYKTENSMPDQSSPLSVKRGTLMAISVQAGTGFAMMCDSALVTRVMANGVLLGEKQLQQVQGVMAGDINQLYNRTDSLSGKLLRQTGYHLLTALSAHWEKKPGYYVNESGALTAHAGYDTYVRTVGTDSGLYFEKNNPQNYLSAAVFSGEPGADSFVGRYRSYKTENTLPTQTQPLMLSAGQLLAITVEADGAFRLFSSDTSAASTLHPGIMLDEEQLSQVDETTRRDGDPFLLQSTETALTFDLPTEKADVFLRYRLERTTNSTKNADCWGLRGVSAVKNGQVLFPVVNEGNWEIALMLENAPDFIGGRQHGSELSVSHTFRVDGKRQKISLGSQLCRELVLEERSALYHPSNETSQVGWHTKEYVITAGGIDIRQSVEWLQDVICNTSYVCMLPVVRGRDTVASQLITGKCRDNLDFTDYDISLPGFTGRPHQKRHGATGYLLWSEETGVRAEVNCRIEAEPESSISFVQNTENQYNKVYFSYCGEAFSVSAGNIWRWQQRYRLNVCAMMPDPAGETVRLAQELAQLRLHCSALTRQRSVANLLDNSDFCNPVNQRNSGTVTASNHYPIDCWFFDKATASSLASAGYDPINRYLCLNNASAGWAALYHRVEASRLKAGMTYTLALHEKLPGNVNIGIYSGNGSETISPSAKVDHVNGLVLKTFTIPENGIANHLLIAIYVTSGVTVAFDWAALYEGVYTTSTLPDYQCKGYAADLASCRRRFVRLKNAVIPCAGNAAGTSISGFLPLDMRSASPPAVTITNANIYLGGGVFHAITGASATIDHGVRLTFTTAQRLAAHQSGNVSIGQLDISAELT